MAARARRSSRPTIPTRYGRPGRPGHARGVFADASGNAQVRTSAGAFNDAASWTPQIGVGYADYPRLADGPSGLFPLGTQANALVVRKWKGSTSEPAQDRRPGRRRPAHLTQTPPGACMPSTGAVRGGTGARLRDLRRRDALAVGGAVAAVNRASAACAPGSPPAASAWQLEAPDGHLVGRARRRRRARGGRVTAGARQVGGRRPRVRQGLHHVGWEAHPADGRGDDPRRQHDRHPQGPRRDDLGGRRHRTKTQTAQFYDGTFKVRQSVPRNRFAMLTTDLTLAAVSRSGCAAGALAPPR